MQPDSEPSIDFSKSCADEPLGLSVAPRPCPAAFEGAVAHRIEFSSRGDRVPGRLLLPETRSGPCPLVIALGTAGEACDSSEFDFLATLIRSGFAIATLDLSLYGERSSAKFSERLLAVIADAASPAKLDANGKALLVEFTRQSVSDVTRAIDALASLPAVDAERTALVGIGHGAALCAIAAKVDVRAKAAVLANCCDVALSQIDPRQFVSSIVPGEVLELGSKATRDNAPALDPASVKTALDFLTKLLGSTNA